MAQWKRAEPITQRSEDQNLALIALLFVIIFSHPYLAIVILEGKSLQLQ